MALSNLGVALYELKDYEEAARAQRKAIAANPNFAEAHSNLGNALHALRQFDEAIAAYRRAIEIKPELCRRLGQSRHHAAPQRQLTRKASSALRHAIALSPHHANAHSGLGILLLMRGDFGEGWDEYEWRLRSTERKGPRFPEQPWQGENLAGKHIYVQAEQGFGDTLQFARYLPLLAARAGRVTLRVHQQLVTLLRESLPGITVLGDRGDIRRPIDCDAALLSLPRLFKTRLETIPATVPYLRPPADAARALEEAARQYEGPQDRRGLGRQSRARQRSPPLHRSVAAGAAVCRARHLVREPAVRPARRRSQKAQAPQDRGSRICRRNSRISPTRRRRSRRSTW